MEKTKTEKPKKDTEEKPLDMQKLSKEAMWMIAIMVGLIAFVLVFFFSVNSMKSFDYKGLTFTREKFGDLDVYHHYFYFNYLGQTYQYNLYLRNDPRRNKVPVEGDIIGLLGIRRNNAVYVSIDNNNLMNCTNSSIAVASISSFLTNNKIMMRGALPDKEEAEAKNTTYADCENNPDDMVIMILSGEETKVSSKGNCYTITAVNCEILDAVEKFEVQAIIDDNMLSAS